MDDWILGSPDFANECRDLLEGQSPRLPERIPLDRIMAAVCQRFGVAARSVKQRGRHGNEARDAAILIARDLRDESLASLAEEFGGVSRSAISETARRATNRHVTSKSIAATPSNTTDRPSGITRRLLEQAFELADPKTMAVIVFHLQNLLSERSD